MFNYEWDIETWVDDEIDDHDFRDRLREFDRDNLIEALRGGSKKLVLVRTDIDGERSWAYVDDGILPTMLSDAYDVARNRVLVFYIREFEKMKTR
jgi:hypothetical protein